MRFTIKSVRIIKCQVWKGHKTMKSSQLVAIIHRLEAMQENTDSEVQVRRFEKEGQERCLISYDPKAETYELEEVSDHSVYQFDDIDLIAIEIYELLQD